MSDSAPDVRTPSLYAADFWYVPGTDTCVNKIGAFARLQVARGAGGNGNLIGVNQRAVGGGDFDGAFQYVKLWRRWGDQLRHASRPNVTRGAPTSTRVCRITTTRAVTAAATSSTPFSPALGFGGQFAYSDGAVVQFAGFTAGRIRSFFDLVNARAYSLAATRLVSRDTASALPALAIRCSSAAASRRASRLRMAAGASAAAAGPR
jgi:hypothetical protein